MALSRFIDGDALVHFRTAVKSSSDFGKIVSLCPTSVAYLLKRYATNQAIAKALQDLRAVAQRPSKTEEEYHSRFVHQHAWAGYPFDTNETITGLINGLDPRIRPAVYIYRESKAKAGKVLYLRDIAVRGNMEGETLRTRSVLRNMASKTSKQK